LAASQEHQALEFFQAQRQVRVRGELFAALGIRDRLVHQSSSVLCDSGALAE
jgi:hypothetical protein